MMRKMLFSYDIGTNSIGWCVFLLNANNEPVAIVDGVRIYSDGREPKSGTSLAEGRRVARSMSRRRDRYKRRRKAVLRTLVEYGLMPTDKAAQKALLAETNDRPAGEVAADVYALRARALDERLPLAHVGRAIFHLNQRRGFKSNRKTDSKDNDQGKIASGISRLGAAIDAAGARTLGEFLHGQRLAGNWVRVRPQRVAGKDEGKEEEGYGFYPERSFLRREFDAIWAKQASLHPDVLTEERREHLVTVLVGLSLAVQRRRSNGNFLVDELESKPKLAVPSLRHEVDLADAFGEATTRQEGEQYLADAMAVKVLAYEELLEV